MKVYLGHIPEAVQYYRDNSLDSLTAIDLCTDPMNDIETSKHSVEGLNILPIIGPWDYLSRLLPNDHLDELIIGSSVPLSALDFIKHAYKGKCKKVTQLNE